MRHVHRHRKYIRVFQSAMEHEKTATELHFGRLYSRGVLNQGRQNKACSTLEGRSTKVGRIRLSFD